MSSGPSGESPQQSEAAARLRDQPPVLTIGEAATLLRIGRNSAYEAARRGEIPTIRLGRRLLVPLAALERLLERAGAPPPEKGGANGQ